MIWLFIGLGILILGIIIYYSVLFFKKFSNRTEKVYHAKSTQRAEKRALKKQERQEKKRLKKAAKEADFDSQNSTKNPHVFTAQGDLFSDNEHAIDLKEEDPDRRVNYDNLNLEGLFEDSNSSSSPEIGGFKKEEDIFSDNIEDMFETYFNDIRPSERNKNKDTFTFSADGSLDGNDDEIKEFLEEFNRVSAGERNSLQEDFEGLSPQMKALMISNFLDKKDI